MAKIIIVGGPTAGGKSGFALELAEKYDSVIINADSQQVYRQIPIITAQPTLQEQCGIPHRLYGFLDINENCSVGIWLDYARKEIDLALAQGKTPIVVGGTGMYLKCLMEGIAPIPDIEPDIRTKAGKLLAEVGNETFHAMLQKLDKESAQKLHSKDNQRMLRAWEIINQTGVSICQWQREPHKTSYPSDIFEGFFINPARSVLYERCNRRFEQMIKDGVLKEVRNLESDIQNMECGIIEYQKPYTKHQLPITSKALGLPKLLSYIHGKITLPEAIEQAQQSTRNYAKRQVTWFRHQLKGLMVVEKGSK